MNVRFHRWLAAVFAVAAATPTLVYAFTDGGLIGDDWHFAAHAHRLGFVSSIHQFVTGVPGRPGAALYLATTFAVFRTHPLPHLLALAALNANVAVLVYLVAQRLLSHRLAVLVAVVWVLLPNRGSTRLWVSVAPEVIAVALLLVGILLLLNERPALAAGVLAVGVLFYESIVVVALVAIVLATRQDRRRLLGLIPVLASAAVIFELSPKRDTEIHHALDIGGLLAAQIGRGSLGPLAVVGALVILAAAIGVYRRDRWIIAGCALLVCGAAPFLAIGWRFATDGIFDRGNMVPGLGTALVVGAIIDRWWKPLAAVAAVALLWVGVQNVRDVADYQAAQRDGRALMARGGTVSELPIHGGVVEFFEPDDLVFALSLQHVN